MARSRSCIFCPNESNAEITKEHLWPRWLSKYLREHHGLKKMLVDEYHGRKRGFSQRKLVELDIQAGTVCKKCNGVWMQELEDEAAPLIIRLLNGVPTVLTDVQQLTLADWITRFSMVIEFTGLKDKFFTQAERERFRETLEPPEHAEVWLADYVGAGLFYHCCHLLRIVSPNPGFATEILHITTGQIGRLAFQLKASRWTEGKRVRDREPRVPRFGMLISGDPAKFDEEQQYLTGDGAMSHPDLKVMRMRSTEAITEEWATRTVPLWPDLAAKRRWPPKSFTSTRGLYEFRDRWGTPSPLLLQRGR